MKRQTIKVLFAIWEKPRFIQSDFAREEAIHFGELASRGMITNLNDGVPTRLWRVTTKGMLLLALLAIVES